jgi:CubicO group peptidase (beta-lactamase class C family)
MTEPYDMSLGGMAGVRFSPERIFDARSFPSGGAGMAGTAIDYIRFLEALRTGGAPILRAATARSAVQDQIGNLDVPFLGAGNRFGFGFGIIVDPGAAERPVGPGSYGWAGVYGTAFWVDPAARLSVVIFTNVAGQAPLGGEVEGAIYAGED